MISVRQQLPKNVFTSWFAYVVRIVVTFLFVPYIAGVLGDARYGVWVIAFQTIAYFSLLDAGLTSALTRYISKFLRDRNYEKISRVLNTANVLYFVVGALVLLGIWVFVTFFFRYFQIPDPALAAEGKTALLILGGFMAFNFVALPFGNTLGAFHRYDIVNGLNIGEEIVRTALMVLMLWRGHGLVALAFVILIMTVVKHLVGAGLLLKMHPEVEISRKLAERATAKMLFSYSKTAFGISLCWLVIFNTDAFLLGLLGSATAAAVYNPAAQLMRYLRNLVNAVALPLIPAISHKEASGDLGGIREIYLKAVRYISYAAFGMAVGIVIYAQPFVSLWLPAEFLRAALVMQILATGTALLLPQIVGHAILFGIEQHGKLLVVLAVEAAAKIVLSVVLIERYGLVGMAMAAVVPQIILFTTVYPYLIAGVLGTSYYRIMRLVVFAGGAAMAVSVPVALFVKWLAAPVSWGALALNGIVVVAALLAGAWLLAAPEDRERAVRWLHIQQ